MQRDKAEQILTKLILVLENEGTGNKELSEALYQGIHDIRFMDRLSMEISADLKHMDGE